MWCYLVYAVCGCMCAYAAACGAVCASLVWSIHKQERRSRKDIVVHDTMVLMFVSLAIPITVGIGSLLLWSPTGCLMAIALFMCIHLIAA